MPEKIKFTIGIPTHNRLDLLRMMARSFDATERPWPYAIRIYDDASSEFSVDTLRDIFPDAVTVVRHSEPLRADRNIQYMYHDFLNYNDDILVNADSDLLFSKHWMERGMDFWPQTDGVLSLFHTLSHAVLHEKNGMYEKSDIGSAGTWLSRAVVKRIKDVREQMDMTIGFDWEWSRILREEGIHIYTVKNSLVQHVGIYGQNSRLLGSDYGEGFLVDTRENGQALNDVLNAITKMHRAWYYLFPFEKIERGSRIVIYGNGIVGQEYRRQVEQSKYAEIVAVIDANPDSRHQVFSLETLSQYSFESIVLAAGTRAIQESMRLAIQDAFGMRYDDAIVVAECLEPIRNVEKQYYLS